MTADHVSIVSKQLKFPFPRVEEILFGVHGFYFDFSSRLVVGRAPCGLDLVCSPLEICMGRLVWRWGGRWASCEL